MLVVFVPHLPGHDFVMLTRASPLAGMALTAAFVVPGAICYQAVRGDHDPING